MLLKMFGNFLFAWQEEGKFGPEMPCVAWLDSHSFTTGEAINISDVIVASTRIVVLPEAL